MRPGTPNFVAERLAEVRKARGITRTALADALNLAANSVSAWELGKHTPGPENLQALAQRLGVPPSRFTIRSADQLATGVFYRSFASATQRSRDRAEARASWLAEVISFLERHLELPPLMISTQSPGWIERSEGISDEIELAAEEARMQMKLGDGPISDITLLLENHGVIVARQEMASNSLDAFTAFRRDGRPIVVLSSDKASAVRSRMDAAHELAHIYLHGVMEPERIQCLHEALEFQAKRFASAFMMPAGPFSDEFVDGPIDALLVLKQRWGASVQAIIVRAQSLDLIDESRARSLFIEMGRRRWRTREPGDDTTPCEQPRVLRRSIDVAREAGRIDAATFERNLGLFNADVEKVLGLSEGYLDSEPLTFQFPRLA